MFANKKMERLADLKRSHKIPVKKKFSHYGMFFIFSPILT